MTSDSQLVAVPEEWAKPPGLAFADPVGTAWTVIAGLQADPLKYRTALERLTTPESHPAWGDFTSAADYLESIGEFGIVTVGRRVWPDVTYVSLLRNVPSGTALAVVRGGWFTCAATFTVVDRPEHGGWLVHALGQPIEPSLVPRSA